MSKETICERHLFRGAMTPPVVGSPDGTIWRKKTTGTNTSVLGTAGVMALVMDSVVEIQNAKLYFGNQLSYAIGSLKRVRFWASLTASSFTPVTAFLGLASNENDALASISQFAVFKVTTSSTLLIDTKDGTNTNTGVSTGGIVWSGGTVKQFVIDFSKGTSDVRFHVDNADGDLRPVAAKTTFNMSGYTGNFQPIVQLQKTSNAATGTLNVVRIDVELNQN